MPSFCSKPQLLDLASPHKPVTRDGCDDRERDCQRESEKCPSSQSVVSICVPLEAIPTQSSQICGGLRDCILVHSLLVLLIFPTYSMSGNWRQRSGLVRAVPHLYICTRIPLTLSQNIPISQVPITASACSLTIMTTTLKSRLDKWSERKPDYVGRERKVNMVTVSSYILPLILERLFANMRDNASSCSY